MSELGPDAQQNLSTSAVGLGEPQEASLAGPDLIPVEAAPLPTTQAVSSSRKKVSFKGLIFTPTFSVHFCLCISFDS